MSWHVTSLVARKIIGSPTLCLLLRSMADKANDDGAGIYASFATLGGMSELSRDTAKRAIKELEARGLVKCVGQRALDGSVERAKPGYYTNEYRIELEAVAALPDNLAALPDTLRRALATEAASPADEDERSDAGASDPVQNAPGARCSLHPVQPAPGAGRPTNLDSLSLTTFDSERTGERVRDPAALYLALAGASAKPKPDRASKAEGSPRPSKRKTAAPETFTPSDATRAVAAALFGGDASARIEEQMATCFDWHRSHGVERIDWDATLRNWMRRSHKDDRSRNPPRPERPPPAGGFRGASEHRSAASIGLALARQAREAEDRLAAGAGARRGGVGPEGGDS